MSRFIDFLIGPGEYRKRQEEIIVKQSGITNDKYLPNYGGLTGILESILLNRMREKATQQQVESVRVRKKKILAGFPETDIDKAVKDDF